MKVSRKDTTKPASIEGRWNLFAVLTSDPGITGIIVGREVTGPPVRYSCIIAAPPTAATVVANGSTPMPKMIWTNGSTITAEAAFD